MSERAPLTFSSSDWQKRKSFEFCLFFVFFVQFNEKEHRTYVLLKPTSHLFEMAADFSTASDVALIPCEIESCERISATLCEHCNNRVCRRHFDEHADLLVQELNPLADNINALGEKISSFRVTEYNKLYSEN